MNTRIRIGKLAVAILVLTVALCGCGKKSDNIQAYNTIVIAEISDSAYGECTLHKDNENSYIYEVRDNEIVNKITNDSLYESQELLRLNEEINKNNITLKDLYTNDTYEATIDESSAHVKYLQDKGYDITRQVNTQDFIDINLSKGKDIKRVVIYPDKIIVCSIEPKELNIENYVRK